MKSRRVIFLAALMSDVPDARRGSTALGGIGEVAIELENNPSQPHCVRLGRDGIKRFWLGQALRDAGLTGWGGECMSG